MAILVRGFRVFGLERLLAKLLKPGWLTGPIFDKELRVSARRRRNYALRFFYIALLTVFVGIVWLGVAEFGAGNAAFQQSRMAAAGKRIITTVVTFQFIATQLLAIIMLSTAISDEVYHRTLGLLMTTPINGLQIVMGKVLSKLLQLALLLGITLPVLAIVRVFGGVSWDYLLSSLCITLTAVLFAGALSLFSSINNRRAYAVIMRVVFILAGLYFILPAVTWGLLGFLLPRLGIRPFGGFLGLGGVTRVMMYISPFSAISTTTRSMLSPTAGMPFHWPIHCAVMLGLSALVLAWAVRVVRRVALRQAVGQLTLQTTRKRRRKRAGPVADGNDSPQGPVKRVHGPPVIWKELRAPFVEGVDNRNSYVGLAMTVAALLFTYATAARQGTLDENFAHVSYGLLFVFMGSVFTIVFSATRITTEKDSQTWSLLLATSLSDWDILLGKAVSTFRRCLPIWGLLAGHVLLFLLVGYIHPIAVLHLFMIVAWLTCLITGAGLYFSTRFGRTTSAVVASFTLALGLWVVGPILAGILSTAGDRVDLFERYMWWHPAVQTELVMAGAAGRQNAHQSWRALEYGTEHVMFHGGRDAVDVVHMTSVLAQAAAAYSIVGLFFFWRAKRRLRRSVF